jgi:cytochrome c oxidase subunit IV
MSSETATAHAAAKPHAAHPTPRTYVMIFVWLTVLTAIEVAVAATVPETMLTLKIGLLVAMAIIKAALVVLFYMHLRYDSFWYWILLLVPLFFVMLLTRYLIIR